MPTYKCTVVGGILGPQIPHKNFKSCTLCGHATFKFILWMVGEAKRCLVPMKKTQKLLFLNQI